MDIELGLRIGSKLKCSPRTGKSGDKFGDRPPAPYTEYGVPGGSVQSENGENGAGDSIIPGLNRS